MKVILLKDVAKIGKRFEVAEVPDGYAMNQLIPKKMAEPATAANLKIHKQNQEKNAASEKADQDRFVKAVESLNDKPLILTEEANEQGHLFKTISREDIAEAAQTESVDLPIQSIVFSEGIKEIGEHEVNLVRGDEKHTITISVVKK